MGIGNGKHNAAHSQTVEIVVNEDQHAQSKGGQSGTYAALDMGLCPLTEGGCRTGLIDQRNENAQQHKENKDAGAIRHSGDQTVVDDCIHRVQRTEGGGQKTACQDTDKQRGVYLFGDQCQADGDNRGNKGPEGSRKAGGFCCTVGSEHRNYGNQDHNGEDRNQR